MPHLKNWCKENTYLFSHVLSLMGTPNGSWTVIRDDLKFKSVPLKYFIKGV